MPTKVVMPQMGEAVVEATITRWLKTEGDTIEAYEPLVEVNTDKVDTEVPSPVDGTVLKILHPVDAVVAVNATLAWVGAPGEAIPAEEEDAPVTEVQAAPPETVAKPATQQKSKPAVTAGVSPVARRMAQEFNVDLRKLQGSGTGGRVTKEDVMAYIKRGASAQPAPPAQVDQTNGDEAERDPNASFISPVVARLAAEHNIDLGRVKGTGKGGRITKFDMQDVIEGRIGLKPAPVGTAKPSTVPLPASGAQPGTVMKLSPVRRAIANHMVESKHTSPHVSTFMEIDMSCVSAHRGTNKAAFIADGAKLTFTVYFIAALAQALKAYPMVNSSWTEDGIALHKAIHIGMATSLGADGLIVPVIRNADELSLLGIARAVNDLSERARAKQLKPDEVQGGTFTLTNHGTSGSLFATPIINQPQCAILSTGAIQKRAVVIDDAIAIRPMVYVGLTFDHRILDGANADYFLGAVKQTLEEWSE
ncbi:MAG: 2-oxo acid dehydrogenase subunit E2 [Anaerolineales bacterium]|nr:2-oxo acid dehydrogenase subunit E2 [Anaerolineales bacterium]